MQGRDADCAGGFGEAYQRSERAPDHPSPRDDHGEEPERHAPQQQALEPFERHIASIERHADLQQVGLAGSRRDYAARYVEPSLIGPHFVHARALTERLDFRGHVVEPERLERRRLHQQTAAVGVVDLVVAGGFLDEGDFVGIVSIVDKRRQAAVETELAAQPAGQLIEFGRGVELELPREEPIVAKAETAQKQRHDGGVDQAEGRPQRERLHVGLSDSM